MNKKNTTIQRTLQTSGFILTTNILWLIVYYIAKRAIYLLDSLRGLNSDLIQGLVIELLFPGYIMYVSLKFCEVIFENSWTKVGVIFSVLLFFGAYFFFGDFIKPTYDSVKTFNTFFNVGFIVSIILGSILSYLEIGKHDRY